MKFILDTNIISALIRNDPVVFSHLQKHREQGIYLCAPVYFEVVRGLLWKRATAKIAVLEQLRARLGWLSISEADWQRAGQLWADSVQRGRRLSDVDLLIAALALRQDAIIVSDDNDFDALTIIRVNWKQA
jgi:predicted nucleic acid-binding protein